MAVKVSVSKTRKRRPTEGTPAMSNYLGAHRKYSILPIYVPKHYRSQHAEKVSRNS